MRRRVLVAATVIALLSFASVAVAAPNGATNPFSPGLPTPSVPTPTVTTPTIINPTTTAGPGSLSGGGVAAIAIGALVLLAGISFFIWRDARRRAPSRHRAATAGAGEGNRPGSKRVKPRKLSPAERRRRKRGRAR